MDIIIKDFEMPDCCDECFFNETEDVYFDLIHTCQITKGHIDKQDLCGFPYGCPLVPLPKNHGDLIERPDVVAWDSNELYDQFGWKDTFDDGVTWMLNKLDNYPVIIPADNKEYKND